MRSCGLVAGTINDLYFVVAVAQVTPACGHPRQGTRCGHRGCAHCRRRAGNRGGELASAARAQALGARRPCAQRRSLASCARARFVPPGRSPSCLASRAACSPDSSRSLLLLVSCGARAGRCCACSPSRRALCAPCESAPARGIERRCRFALPHGSCGGRIESCSVRDDRRFAHGRTASVSRCATGSRARCGRIIYITAPGAGFARPERQHRARKSRQRSSRFRDRRAQREPPRAAWNRMTSARSCSLMRSRLRPASASGFQLLAGDAGSGCGSAYAHGALVISEPLAWRLRLRVGRFTTLDTARGPHAFEVAGIYREYGNDARHGVARPRGLRRCGGTMMRSVALGLYLRPRAQPADRVIAGVERGGRRTPGAAHPLERAICASVDGDLRAHIHHHARALLADAGVAALSLVSALVAWQLERARELALLRALGLTPLGMAWLIEAQTLFVGCAHC